MHILDHRTLELRWEATKCVLDVTYESEAVRREKVCVCLLEGQNEDLKLCSYEQYTQLSALQSVSQKLQQSLKASMENVSSLRSSLDARTYDLNSLRSELSLLRTTTGSSGALEGDHAAPDADISLVKKEMEYLRSQQSAYKRELSEKRALQVQLSAVEIELESERRNANRMQASSASQSAEEGCTKAQLISLRTKFEEEIQRRRALEEEMKTESVEYLRKTSILEKGAEDLRKQLQATEESLRKQQSNEIPAKVQSVDFETQGDKSKPSLKEISSNVNVPTPNAATRVGKHKSLTTSYGLQSDFSTTPWIKRTGKSSRDTEVTKLPNVSEQENTLAGLQVTSSLTMRSNVSNKQDTTDMMEGDSNSTTNANEIGREIQSISALRSKRSANKPMDDGASSKRKRKILGGALGRSTIEDDEDTVQLTEENQLSSLINPLDRFGSFRMVAGKARGISNKGAFSPLKRNRRTAA